MRNQKDSSGSHSHPQFCNPQSLVESCSGIPEGGREENTTLSLPALSVLRMKLAWKTINHSDNERQFKWDSMQVKRKSDPWISKELKVREDTVREMGGETHSWQALQSSVLYMLETTPQLYQCLHSCNFPTAMLLQQWYNENNNRMTLPSTLFLSFFSSVFFTEANACPAVEEEEFRRDGVMASSAEHWCSEMLVWVCVHVQWGECRRAKGADVGRWRWNQDGGEIAYMKQMTEQTSRYFENNDIQFSQCWKNDLET